MQRPTPVFAAVALFAAELAGACATAQPSPSANPSEAGPTAAANPGAANPAPAGTATAGAQAGKRSSNPADVAALFTEWREFQKPKLVDGVPDYSAAAMAAQQRELAAWQARANAFDVTGWTVAQQVDLQIVRAEM